MKKRVIAEPFLELSEILDLYSEIFQYLIVVSLFCHTGNFKPVDNCPNSASAKRKKFQKAEADIAYIKTIETVTSEKKRKEEKLLWDFSIEDEECVLACNH